MEHRSPGLWVSLLAAAVLLAGAGLVFGLASGGGCGSMEHLGGSHGIVQQLAGECAQASVLSFAQQLMNVLLSSGLVILAVAVWFAASRELATAAVIRQGLYWREARRSRPWVVWRSAIEELSRGIVQRQDAGIALR